MYLLLYEFLRFYAIDLSGDRIVEIDPTMCRFKKFDPFLVKRWKGRGTARPFINALQDGV